MKCLFISAIALCASTASLHALTALTTDPVEVKLVAPDGALGDEFGFAVALEGSTGLVGSSFDDDNGTNSGSAYLFDTTTGSLLQKLTAPDGAAGDDFGVAVAFDGTTALIGSQGDDDNGSNSGSAYLFDTTTGSLLQKLTAPDGASNDRFGVSVALDGTTALVGSYLDDDNGSGSGSAYVFDTTTGGLLQKLTAPDGAVSDNFGRSVALDGTTALIGSPNDDDAGPQSGSAYVFDTITGNLLQKLTAPDGASSDQFGWSVALDGTTALIGSYLDDGSAIDSGSAYLFDITTGSFLSKLTAPDGADFDNFGISVALDSTSALIGSYRDDDNGNDSGSAYLFDVPTGTMTYKFSASDGVAIDEFGFSVALSENRALVGALRGDGIVGNTGAAYAYDLAPIPLPASVWLLGSALGLLVLRSRRRHA